MKYTISITCKSSLISYIRIALPPETNYHRTNTDIFFYTFKRQNSKINPMGIQAKCCQSWLLLEAPEGNLLSPPVSRGSQYFLACKHITPVFCCGIASPLPVTPPVLSFWLLRLLTLVTKCHLDNPAQCSFPFSRLLT